MHPRPLTRDELRALDRRAMHEFHIPGVVLMENAGRAASRWLMDQPDFRGPIAICCGRGNNGGDGFVMARHLEAHGHDVVVLLIARAGAIDGDAAVQLRILEAAGTPIQQWDPSRDDATAAALLNQAHWIVDALLGTGLQGEVREPMRRVIHRVNDCPARKLAVDIPSGLDCDRGEPLGSAVRADLTATFAAEKLGFANPAARAYTGTIRLCDIGLPRKLLEQYFTASPEQRHG